MEKNSVETPALLDTGKGDDHSSIAAPHISYAEINTTPASESAAIENSTKADKSKKKDVPMISPTDLSWRKRRMTNAYGRYSQIADDLDKVARTLRTRTIKEDEIDRMRKLTPAEIVTHQTRKRELTLTKQEAKMEYLRYKREYNSASRLNLRLRKKGFNDNKEESRLLQAVAPMVNVALESLAKARTRGYEDRVEDLLFLASESKRKDFRIKAVALLVELNKDVWENPLRFQSVATELVKGIYAEFRRHHASNDK
jgi:hypothetical protein